METHYFFSVYPRIDSPLLLTYSFISANSFVKFTYSSITPLFPGHRSLFCNIHNCLFSHFFIHSIVEGYIYFHLSPEELSCTKKLIPNTTTHPTISITI